MKDQHLISVLVSNKSGALTRISGLFARRGFNIESLSVCTTEDPRISRMTITSTDDETILKQIIKQLDKLVDVLKVTEMERDTCVSRELLMVKIRVRANQRPELESTCNLYKAKTIDVSPDSMILELTGEPNKIDGFINVIKPYGIVELTRTGQSALQRGLGSINDLADYNKQI